MRPPIDWTEYTTRYPIDHPRYHTTFPNQLFVGPSLLLASGLGLYALNHSRPLLAGLVLGKYWGPSTANGGIDAIYLPQAAPLPPAARAQGAYLLRHGQYMVDCDPACPMGYLNDPFRLANCFFQPDPDDHNCILLILRVNLHQGQLHELYVNYGASYWRLHFHLLSAEAQQACAAFYNLSDLLPRGA